MTHITEDFFSVRMDETHETNTLNVGMDETHFYMVTFGMRGNDVSLFLSVQFLYAFAQGMEDGDWLAVSDEYDQRYTLEWNPHTFVLSVSDTHYGDAVVESLQCRALIERDFIIESLVNEAQAHDFY